MFAKWSLTAYLVLTGFNIKNDYIQDVFAFGIPLIELSRWIYNRRQESMLQMTFANRVMIPKR